MAMASNMNNLATSLSQQIALVLPSLPTESTDVDAHCITPEQPLSEASPTDCATSKAKVSSELLKLAN